jgi:hypothetical protein
MEQVETAPSSVFGVVSVKTIEPNTVNLIMSDLFGSEQVENKDNYTVIEENGQEIEVLDAKILSIDEKTVQITLAESTKSGRRYLLTVKFMIESKLLDENGFNTGISQATDTDTFLRQAINFVHLTLALPAYAEPMIVSSDDVQVGEVTQNGKREFKQTVVFEGYKPRVVADTSVPVPVVQDVTASVIPTGAHGAPIGDTGPALAIIVAAGASMGLGWARRRKRR